MRKAFALLLTSLIVLLTISLMFTSVASATVYHIRPYKTMVYNIAEGPNEVDLVDYDMVFILTTWQDIPANEDASLRAYVEGGGILVLSHDDYPHEYSKDPANDITNHFGISFVDPDNYFNSYINFWHNSHPLVNGVTSVKSSTFGRLNVGSPLSGWTTTALANWDTGNIFAVVSEKDTGTGKLVIFGDEYAWESSWGWSGVSNEQWLENILSLTTPHPGPNGGALVDICYAEWDYQGDYDPYGGGRNWADFRGKFAEMGWDLTFNGHFDDCGNPGMPPIPAHVSVLPPPECITDDDCPSDYYDDWEYYCDGDNVRKRRLLHDFYCDGGTCTDHTSWVDDQLVEDCNQYDGWYPDGDNCEYRDYFCDLLGGCDYVVTGTLDCDQHDGWYYTDDNCEYRDYFCVIVGDVPECQYVVTDTLDCDQHDGWYYTDDNCEYQDYFCVIVGDVPECQYVVTDTLDCDQHDGWYYTDDNCEYRDYFCVIVGDVPECQYDVTDTLDCDQDDGWYYTDDNCEYRDYFCVIVGDVPECQYDVTDTLDCDQDDGWYYTDDNCEYRDYFCDLLGGCDYVVTDTLDCDQHDGWYYTDDNCEYRDYFCVIVGDVPECQYDVTDTLDCDQDDGWYYTDDNCEYRDYFCDLLGGCDYVVTDTLDCDQHDGWYYTDDNCEYRDYFCVIVGDVPECQYDVTDTLDCDQDDGWYYTDDNCEYRDYFCDLLGGCDYVVTDTLDCDQHDGWYYTDDNCEYRDYFCVIVGDVPECQYDVTDTLDCDQDDGWYYTDDNCEYRDYFCDLLGGCDYVVTDYRDADQYDGWYSDGDNCEYRDYYYQDCDQGILDYQITDYIECPEDYWDCVDSSTVGLYHCTCVDGSLYWEVIDTYDCLEGEVCVDGVCEEEVPEFPAGVTAVFGATLFIFLMMRRKYIEK